MTDILQSHRTQGGTLHYCRHDSTSTGTPMRYSLFLPDGPGPFATLLWLSGLTCTEDNFTTKANAYRTATQLGLAVLACDTSPRGEAVANDAAYDLGQGAGFYVDATQAPWAPHFQMERYVTAELLTVVRERFPIDLARVGISGHSMGGHGALTLAMRHPQLFRSVSAFSPICSPLRCPWGEKAFAHYLGDDRSQWEAHDATWLISQGVAAGRFDNILVDQGLADSFLEGQLKPELLEQACAAAGQPLTLRRQAGYDHSYFFISTFIADHLQWHAERLGA